MKYLLAALILWASPANAQEVPCFQAKKLLHAMLTTGYVHQVFMEVNHTPVYIFVNSAHEYQVVQYKDEKTACVIGGGYSVLYPPGA